MRTAHQPDREIAALVAATDGSTVFLLLPPAFWALPDVAPLVRWGQGCCVASTTSTRADCPVPAGHAVLPPAAERPSCPPLNRVQVPQLTSGAAALGHSGLTFDGLCHVRFSFDRLAMRRMQQALADASKQQLDAGACWAPPAEAPHHRAAALQRLQRLQPEAEAVADAVAGMQERGRQRLNAEQRQAVAALVCGGGRAYPYALCGPPVRWGVLGEQRRCCRGGGAAC